MSKKTPKSTKLTQMQLEAIAEAVIIEQKAGAAFEEAQKRRSKVVGLVLDAHGAPKDGQVNLEQGVVIHAAPEAPAAPAAKKGGKAAPAAPAPTE